MFGVFGAILALLRPIVGPETGMVTALSEEQISMYKPFTYFASTAYCRPARTLAWNCGGSCSFCFIRYREMTGFLARQSTAGVILTSYLPLPEAMGRSLKNASACCLLLLLS